MPVVGGSMALSCCVSTKQIIVHCYTGLCGMCVILIWGQLYT